MSSITLLPPAAERFLSGMFTSHGVLAAAATGIVSLSQPRVLESLRQIVYERFGSNVTVYVGQRITRHILLQLRKESWQSAAIESPMGRLPGTKPIYLPSEGTASFSFRGTCLQVIRRRNVHREKESLTILGFSRTAVHEFVEYCQEEGDRSQGIIHWTPSPQAFQLKGYDTWDAYASGKPARTLDSVALPDGHKHRLQQRLSTFTSKEQRDYNNEIGDVHCQTILIDGPPGCGKTSCAKAIAGELKYDMYWLSVTDPTLPEDELICRLRKIEGPCIVVLDELDTALRDTALHRSTNNPHGNLIEGLLNGFLDGGYSVDNVLVILLANDASQFPHALTREGRVDEQFHLTNASRSMARELFVICFAPRYKLREKSSQDWGDIQIHADAFANRITDFELSPAAITDYFKGMQDPREALKNMGRLYLRAGAEGKVNIISESSHAI